MGLLTKWVSDMLLLSDVAICLLRALNYL